MKPGKNLLFTLILGAIAVFIHLYSGNSIRVENQYATRIYPAFGRFLRYLFGWLPFSIGDVLYGLLIVWLIWNLFSAIKAVIKKEVTLQRFSAGAGKALRILMITYILFNAFWGINYNRVGIAEQLDVQMDKYSTADLQVMNGLLAEKVNATKKALVNRQEKYPAKKELFKKVADAYRQAEHVYPFLQYRPVSLKPSVWSLVGNYMGFTGYYNPFTGEGQVNTLVPKFLQPFTTCHEVAHQLGYAKEREASFVAYLAASASQDTLLHYSVYLDLFMYSNRNLFETDSLSAREFTHKLLPEVLADLKEWRAFNKKYRNPVEPVFRWIYGVYLKQNQQPQGVLSYDEVTGFMIAYYKKYGKI
ncbi:MAG: DUF3810 domain-containing protein [Chitinophagaceae bacterium]|nr:DUF3810 domain-containing protein [Chitinophagaceae bacterium]MBK9533510.1 DUF3810 domain-containing protein [Chitinophagaceae bacterium]